MAFQEAIDKYIREPFNPLSVIRKTLSQFTASPEEYEKVGALIEKTIESFNGISSLCEKGIKLFDGKEDEIKAMKDNLEPEKLDGIMEQLLFLKKQCIALDPSAWQLFFAHVGQSFYLAHEMETFKYYNQCNSPEKALVEVALHQREWFEVVGGLIGVCIQVLEKTKRGGKLK
jgi:hypothetical protein